MAFGVASYASAAALTWTADETIDLSDSDINLTIISGSRATSLVVGTGTLQVVVANTDVFTVTSATTDFSFSGNTTSLVSSTCPSSTTTATVTGGPDGETITITPGGSCSSGGASGGGGGNSSGGSSSGTTTTATPATPATPAVPATPSAPGATYYNFGAMTLKVESTGEAVKELQRFLNATMNLGLVVDGMFGPHTASVMKQWQTAHGLVADGLIGPLTKAAMLVSLGATPPHRLCQRHLQCQQVQVPTTLAPLLSRTRVRVRLSRNCKDFSTQP